MVLLHINPKVDKFPCITYIHFTYMLYSLKQFTALFLFSLICSNSFPLGSDLILYL